MELRDYWNTVRRRWWLILACVVLAVGAALAYAASVAPVYSSSARVFLSTTGKNASDQYKGSQLVALQAGSYADLASGSKLAAEVSQKLGGTPNARALQKHIVATIPAQGIIELKATDSVATRARDIAQAYAVSLTNLITQLQDKQLQDKQLQTGNGAKSAVISAEVVDSAALPEAPDSGSAVIDVLAGLVLGLALGMGLAVLLELLDDSVREPTDVARATGGSVLGSIPRDARAADASPIEGTAGHDAWAEGFRVLRTNVLYAATQSTGEVLVVAGIAKGDGASTIATNLAGSLASTQRRVALLECDLRHPTFADRMHLEPGGGLTTVLNGRAAIEESLRSVGDRLSILPCGPVPPNPTELLSSPAMSELLAKLRAEFDLVILDAPPVLPVADAATLAAQADGTLLVARHRKTKEDDLSRATDRLEAVRAELLGVVVNQAKLDRGTRAYSARQPQDPQASQA